MNQALLLLLLPVALPRVTAADWPRWRGPSNDGHIPPDVAVPEKLPEEIKAVWRIKIGDGMASPVVSGGKVFYLDNQQGQETAHAVDAATGHALWHTAFDAVHKDHQSAPGPRCTPVADGERLYVQSCRGALQCLHTADGKRLWGVNYVNDFKAVYYGLVSHFPGTVPRSERYDMTATPRLQER